MGNGNRAAQKRERNAKDAKPAPGSKSQLKTNQAAKTIICKICRQDFLSTAKQPALEEHAQNKHSKTYSDCFA